MDIKKLYTENTEDGKFICIDLESDDCLDNIAARVISRDRPDFLMAFSTAESDGKLSLRYCITGGQPIADADLSMDKEGFVRLFLGLMDPFISCGDWFMDPHNLLADPEYVYIEREAQSVRYLYIPVDQYHNRDEVIIEFLKNIVVRINVTDDSMFLLRIIRMFLMGNADLDGLYKIFAEEASAISGTGTLEETEAYSGNISGQDLKEPYIQQEAPAEDAAPAQSHSMAPEAQAPEIQCRKEDVPCQPEAEYTPPYPSEKQYREEDTPRQPEAEYTPLYSPEIQYQEEDTPRQPEAEYTPPYPFPFQGSWNSQEEEGQYDQYSGYDQDDRNDQPDEPVQQYWQQPEQGYYGGFNEAETDIAGSRAGYEKAPAWLELVGSEVPGAMEQISLEFEGDYITIGRISSNEIKPDVAFPAEFRRISRQHARIERCGGELYIVDAGSANFTLLDGQRLVPNQPYLLQDGMVISFTEQKPVMYRVHC